MNRLSDNRTAFDAKLPYNEHNRTVERICTLTGWKGGSQMLYTILKGNMKGLLSYCGMIADLEDIFHCHVDLVMKNAIRDEKLLD